MGDPFKSIVTLADAKRRASQADTAARVMAKHCDARVRRYRKALEGIDEFAWSMVSLPPAAARNLQKRLDAVRKILKDDTP